MDKACRDRMVLYGVLSTRRWEDVVWAIGKCEMTKASELAQMLLHAAGTLPYEATDYGKIRACLFLVA